MKWHMVSLVALAAGLLAALSPARAQLDPMTGHALENSGVYSFTPVPSRVVSFDRDERPGTIVVNTSEKRLYLVMEDDKALRYGIGVGREGARFSGSFNLTRKIEWPSWTPTESMRERNPGLPVRMAGGEPGNPMGARALYIGDTLYRIHGTTEEWSVGRGLSSGCIRMTNEDVIDLYERVETGAQIVVLQ